jgi:hypothetical protein
MAKIGLRYLTYAKYQEETDPTTQEVSYAYSGKRRVGKSISAELTVNNANATLFAEDGPDEKVSEFADAQLSIGVKDLDYQTQQDFYGHKHIPADTNARKPEWLKSNVNDAAGYLGVAFYTPMYKNNSGGKRTYEVWFLYKTSFGEPTLAFRTKERDITFTTPTTVGEMLMTPDGDWKLQSSFDTPQAAQHCIDQLFINIKPEDYVIPVDIMTTSVVLPAGAPVAPASAPVEEPSQTESGGKGK